MDDSLTCIMFGNTASGEHEDGLTYNECEHSCCSDIGWWCTTCQDDEWIRNTEDLDEGKPRFRDFDECGVEALCKWGIYGRDKVIARNKWLKKQPYPIRKAILERREYNCHDEYFYLECGWYEHQFDVTVQVVTFGGKVDVVRYDNVKRVKDGLTYKYTVNSWNLTKRAAKNYKDYILGDKK